MADYKWINRQVQEELSTLPTSFDRCYIYSVPCHLRAANRVAFTPLVVSIGPLHRHADHLQHTRPHKLKYLKSFLQDQYLQTYCDIIAKNLTKIRESYAEPEVRLMDSRELVMIVLVDAAFLIELFRRSSNPRLIEPKDQMFYRPRMVEKVSHDIQLVENQLPYFILRELYDATYGGTEAPSLMKMVCTFLNIPIEGINWQDDPQSKCKHFLDLLRENYLPALPRPYSKWEDYTDGTGMIHKRAFRRPAPSETVIVCKTATALQEAGVKFRVAADGFTRLLDIKFDEHGTLAMSKIEIGVDTESQFRNIAVHEQLHYYTDSYIIDYILFLDFLISTPADVALLEKHGIIVNWLGSNERVVELFSGLNRQLRLKTEDFYYAPQCKQLNDFYKKRWNHYVAVLKLKYFNHPWAVIAIVYAVVTLLLAVAQVTTGVISVIK